MRAIITLSVLSIAIVTGPWTYGIALVVSNSSTAKSSEPCVYVYGSVVAPGRYRLFTGMTVLDAVQAAGGFTNSHGNKIWISRADSPDTRISYKRGTAKAPPILKAGDIIDVPKEMLVDHRQGPNREPAR